MKLTLYIIPCSDKVKSKIMTSELLSANTVQLKKLMKRRGLRKLLPVLFVFLFFFVFNLVIRLGTYSLPIIDRHNFRQTDTYATILLLYEHKTSILKPQFFQAPDPENVNHYYLAEFPIYQGIVALLFGVFGENLVIARLFNVFLFSIAVVCTYLLGQKTLGKKTALLSGLLLSIFPPSFFWARTITPDILALVAFLLSLVTLLYFKHRKVTLVASIFLSVAVLIKPFYFVFAITHLVMVMFLGKNKHSIYFDFVKLYCIPIVLFLGWRFWFSFFPASARTDPSFISLMHEGIGYFTYWENTQWISLFIQERFMGELLTPLGGIFSVFGLTALIVKEKSTFFSKLLLSWLIASSAITIFIAAGSYWHDYYALHWLPLSALVIMYGLKTVFEKIKTDTNLLFLCSILFLFFFYYLAFLPFLSYKQNYFSNTAFYSDSLKQDYVSMLNFVPEEESVLFLLPHYNPQPLNTMRRFGFIFDYTELCSKETNPYQVLDSYEDKGALYGIIYTEENEALECLKNTHPTFIRLVAE